MSTVQVRISSDMYKTAKNASALENRTANQQIEYWTKIGRFAEIHPDLPFSAIKDILRGISEEEQGQIEDFDLETDL